MSGKTQYQFVDIMKNRFFNWSSIIVLMLFFLSSGSPLSAKSVSNKEALLSKLNRVEAPPEIDAKAWLLMEAKSGWVVASKNAELALAPASITKLMVNYIVFDKLKRGELSLDDNVSISEAAWRAEGSRMFADVNTEIKLKHLLKSTVVQSGNDAAIALAEHISGSEADFAVLMNQTAAKLGLRHSHFENSSGLPALGHAMSAIDIAALSAAIIEDFPEYYAWYSEKEYTHNQIRQYNRNKLLWKDSSVDGLKTGFTNDAGYCLVGSAVRENERWLAVVMGAENETIREKAVLELLNYGFETYQPVTLLNRQGGIVSADVYGGESEYIRLRASDVAKLVIPAGRESEIATELQINPYYQAPIASGQSMGMVSLKLDGVVLLDMPVMAMSTISSGGWWKRLTDSLKLQWREMWSS